jgi:hypothetical protein
MPLFLALAVHSCLAGSASEPISFGASSEATNGLKGRLAFAQRAQFETETLDKAMEFENAGDWGEALACWEKWRPLEDCTGAEAATKNYHIAICLLRLGNTQKAVSNCLQNVFGPYSRCNGFASTPLLLLKLYQASDQTPDLVQMVDRFERKQMAEYREKGYFTNQPASFWRRTLPTRPIREAFQIESLKVQTNVTELIAIAQDSSWVHTDTTKPTFTAPDWRCQLAANALANLGDPAIEPMGLKAMNPQSGNISWLLYALGRSHATNAINVLSMVAKHGTISSYEDINLIMAVSMHEEKGRELMIEISQLTEYMKSGLREAARRFIAQPKVYPVSFIDFDVPKIKPGELPKIYPGLN